MRGGKCHAPSLHLFSSTKYIRYEQQKPCTVRAFLGLVLNPFVYLVGLLCFFLKETKRKIKKDLVLEGLGRIFPLMGNKDNEYGAAGGCLAGLGNLLIIGLVLMVLYAWATHENPIARFMFWVFMGVIIYFGWIEPSLDPEPVKFTREWYDWKSSHMH